MSRTASKESSGAHRRASYRSSSKRGSIDGAGSRKGSKERSSRRVIESKVRYEVNNYPEGMTLQLCTKEEIGEHIQRLMDQLHNKDHDARRKAAEALSDYVAGNYISGHANPTPVQGSPPVEDETGNAGLMANEPPPLHPADILVEGLRERDRESRIGSAMSLSRMGAGRVFPIRLALSSEEAAHVAGVRNTKLAKLNDITNVRMVKGTELAAGDSILLIWGGNVEKRMEVATIALQQVSQLDDEEDEEGVAYGQTNFLVPIEQFHFTMDDAALDEIAELIGIQVFLNQTETLIPGTDQTKFYCIACVGTWEQRCDVMELVHERMEPDPDGQGPLIADIAGEQLARSLEHRDREFRIEVAKALAVIGPPAAMYAAQAAADQLEDQEGGVFRSECLKTLGAMGEAAAHTAQAVSACLQDLDPDVRRMAALALKQMGPAAAPGAAAALAHAVRPLTEKKMSIAHEGPHREIRQFAAEALLAMGEAAAPFATEALARILREDSVDDILRYTALRALGHMRAQAAPQVRRIACVLQEDPVDFVREAAADCLVQIGCPDALQGAMAIGDAKDIIARASEVVAAAKAQAAADAEARAIAKKARHAGKAPDDLADDGSEKISFHMIFEGEYIFEAGGEDEENFKNDILKVFQEKFEESAADEDDLKRIKICLLFEGAIVPEGAIVVEVAGPPPIIEAMKELPLSGIQVSGLTGRFSWEEKPPPKKGLGRKGGAKGAPKRRAIGAGVAAAADEPAPADSEARTVAQASDTASAPAQSLAAEALGVGAASQSLSLRPRSRGQGAVEETVAAADADKAVTPSPAVEEKAEAPAAELEQDAAAPAAAPTDLSGIPGATGPAPSSKRDQRIFASRRRGIDATQVPGSGM